MNDPRVYSSIPVENSAFAALDQRQATRTVGATLDDGTVARVAQIHDQFPWMQGEAILALARSGLDPSSIEAQQIGTAAAKSKSSSGFGWHSLGDVVKVGGGLVGRALQDVGSAVSKIAKPAVRTAALGLNSLTQETEGVFRNVAAISPEAAGAAAGAALGSIVPGVGTAIGAGVGGVIGGGLGALVDSKHIIKGQATWEPQSAGGVAIDRLLHGQPVNLGSGFIPNPDAAIKQEQKSRETVTINGHAITPGRLLAAGIVQPGTTAYNVLSGLTDAALVTSHLDPGAFVAGETGNVIRNRNLFTDAGGLLADRPTILPEKAMQWWNGATGRGLADTLANESSPYQIYKATGGKLPINTVRDLASATTVPEVDSILSPLLGAEVTGKFGYDTFHPLSNVRMLQLMPQTAVDISDNPISQQEAVATAERWMKNVKAPPQTIDDTVSKMINAQSPQGRYTATKDLMDATKQVLVDQYGVDPQKAHALTRLQETAVEDTRKYNLDALGQDVQVPGMYIDGTVTNLPQPHLFAEMTNRTVSLPDARDIRRVATKWAPLLNNPAVAIPRMTLEAIQEGLWKPFTLLRGALVTRTMLEAQARMAAGDLESAYSHPLSYVAWAAGRDSKVGSALQKIGVDAGKGGADLLGDSFIYKDASQTAEGLDAFNKGMQRGWSGFKDDSKYLPFWRGVSKDDPQYAKSLANELIQLHSDPVARTVANATDGLDAVKQSFWDGPLSAVRNQMAENAQGLASRDVADRYIDSIADRIAVKTGGNDGLLNVVANGNLGDGGALVDATRNAAKPRLGPTKELVDHINSNMDALPDTVKGQVSVRDGGIGQKYNDATRFMFSKLMAEPQNKLVNSPTFKQLYWQRAEQLIPAMSSDARDAAIQMARSQGLPDVADRMAGVAAKIGETATPLTLEHADAVAKGDALEGTWKLLHHLTDRYQFFDAARLALPFGDAWAQMLTKWSKIGVEHPEVLRRATQVVQGGRDAGFFYKNAQGQEVFNYPASGWVSKHLFGVPVPMTGRLDGLSMMTDVLPGVGPVVQVPAAAMLPDKPEWDWARNALFPAGQPDTQSGVVEAFLPAWLQKMREANVLSPVGIHRDNAQWNSTVMDTARYLSSTGNYDTSTVDGMNKMLTDARDKAKYVYLLRGAAQFFVPSAPTPQWEAYTKGDKTNALHLTVVDQLVKEYHDLQQKDPQNATQQMLDKYGDGIFLLLQGKTAEVTPGAVSAVGADWEKAHAGLVKSFPEVAGLFAPDDGTLDSAAFQRQLDLGNRVRLTPEQAVRLANNRLAATIYHNASNKIGPYPNTPQRAWLSNLREMLTTAYPGFGDQSGLPQKTQTSTLVTQIQAAVKDPRLADNPAAQATNIYLAARDKASQAALAAGLSKTGFTNGKAMAGTRDWLRQIGAALVQQNPEFQQVWDRVFDRELVDDTTSTQQAA